MQPRRDQGLFGEATLGPLVGLFLAGFLAFGIGVYSFTQFMAPVQAEFGWTRATLGSFMSAFWAAAPSVLLAAWAVDRIGIRWVVGTGVAIEACGLFVMAHVATPMEFIAVRFAMGIGKCFMVTSVPIAAARWFRIRTALACAITLSGWHVGGLALAPLASRLITRLGWREAAVALGIVMLAGGALAVTLLRAPPGARAAAPGVRPVEPGATAHAWVLGLIGIITVVYYAGYATFLSQLNPILRDAGFDPPTVGTLTGTVALCAAGGTVLGGALVQRMRPYSAVGLLLVVAAALEIAAAGLHRGMPLTAVTAILMPFGLVIGGGDPLLIDTLRRCTPLARYNTYYGWWYLACLAGLAIAPIVAGAAFDRLGNYDMVFNGLALGAGLLGLGWFATTRAAKAADAPAVEPRLAASR